MITRRAWRSRTLRLFGPSLVLLPVFALYQRYDGLPHFFLHTLMGWDVGLCALLTATFFGRRWSHWDGCVPLLVALYAMTPDTIYAAGPYHRDWMDVFLFHVSLDEILPYALPVLGVLWVVLLLTYFHCRLHGVRAGSELGAEKGIR